VCLLSLVHGFARTIESEAETLYLSHEEDLSLAAASLDKSNTYAAFFCNPRFN